MPRKNEILSPFRYAVHPDLTPRRSLEESINNKYDTQLHPGWRDIAGYLCAKPPNWICIDISCQDEKQKAWEYRADSLHKVDMAKQDIIYELWAEGATPRQIASKLNINPNKIELILSDLGLR